MGKVVSINIAEKDGAEIQSIQEVKAHADQGLEGDRYYLKQGTFSKKDKPDRQITFIEAEAVEAIERDYQVTLDAKEARRNIVTQGIALNHLVGKKFRVGEAVCEGIKLCEPCGYLQGLVKLNVKDSLIHRGGLRARILESGMIRENDEIQILV